jgi:hypothetical protein
MKAIFGPTTTSAATARSAGATLETTTQTVLYGTVATNKAVRLAAESARTSQGLIGPFATRIAHQMVKGRLSL